MLQTLFSFTTQTRRTPRHTSESYMQRKQGPCVTELVRYHMENIPQVLKEQQLRTNLELKSIHCSEQELNLAFKFNLKQEYIWL